LLTSPKYFQSAFVSVKTLKNRPSAAVAGSPLQIFEDNVNFELMQETNELKSIGVAENRLV